MEQRLKRKITATSQKFSKSYLIPFWSFVWAKIKRLYFKITELEKHYRRQAKISSVVNLKKENLVNLIKEKNNLATDLFNQQKYKEAEESYIEIIALDSKNVEAYLGLAKVYLALEDTDHAKELYQYVLRIDEKNNLALAGLAEIETNLSDWAGAKGVYEKILANTKDNAEYYFDYGYVLEQLGEHPQALEAYQKAVDLKPNDPRYLDYLLKESIINKKKYLAYKIFDQLKEANPENQKIDEFKKMIEEI
jgi:tetratricopeptide (TPR) repeat protein